jgi:HlyD family secretion protein
LWWSQQRNTASPVWQGYAEADYVKAAPVEQGLLTEISVARGDQIAKGAPLFTQDDTQERAARDQAARQLAQAEEQLANLEAGMKPTEVAQAEANLTDAGSTLERARADL